MEEYRELELRQTKLRVYKDGSIWRMYNKNNKYGKKGEWGLVNGSFRNGYLLFGIDNKTISFHRIIGYVYLGLDINDKSQEIDHINRIKNDNRVENLRIVSHFENQWNIGAKGVYFKKRCGKWVAQIQKNNVKKHLGYYDTEEEASKAYQDAKLIHHII
jgi:HNH endonuclease/AP2 domain